MGRSKKKNFVLDTNVILHDFRCLDNFEENDIYIPIVVLEELDKFKKGNDQINYNAREFLRQLDDITDDDLFTNGAPLGNGMGKLYIINSAKMQERIYDIFPEQIPDHRILASLLDITERDKKVKTILVTKDINLRMKARSLGLIAEDYINDKVADLMSLEKEHQTFKGLDAEIIDRIYASPEGIDFNEFDLETPVNPNECFIMRNGKKSVLARYNPFSNRIKRIEKQTCFGIQPRNAEQALPSKFYSIPMSNLWLLPARPEQAKPC